MPTPPCNPYSPPLLAEVLPEGDAAPPRPYRAIFRRWELVRPFYNVLVGLAGLLGVGGNWPQLSHPVAVASILVYALAANALYFLGPGIEAYLHLLGVRGKWVLPALFSAGTTLAMLLTFALAYAEGDAFFQEIDKGIGGWDK